MKKRLYTRYLITICIITLPCLLHTSMGQQPNQKKWRYSIGLGMATALSYLGDDDYQLLIFPHFGVKYGDKFFASFFEGVGYNLVKTNTWRIGPILKTNIGRFEDGTVPSSVMGKTKDLAGLGDVGFTAEPGAFIEYTKKLITTKLEFRQGIRGHKGLIVEISTNYRSVFKLDKKVIYFSIGPEIGITGYNFNNAFFGIDTAQSLNTELEVYQAKSDILSYGLSGSLIVPINEKLSIITLMRYSKLGKVASDSRLLQKSGSSHQSIFGFLLNYTF